MHVLQPGSQPLRRLGRCLRRASLLLALRALSPLALVAADATAASAAP